MWMQLRELSSIHRQTVLEQLVTAGQPLIVPPGQVNSHEHTLITVAFLVLRSESESNNTI